jgi:8-oxo-dGTP pyrophosphatase MutT (NUDIX family)
MGAGKESRIKRGLWQCAVMAVSTAVVLVAILLIFGHHIAALFLGAAENPQEIIDLAMRMFTILAAGYIVFSLNMVLLGVIRGAGDAATPLWASIITTLAVRLPSAFLLVHFLGRPEALMYSLLLGWFSNTLVFTVAYKIGRWKKMGVVKQAASVKLAALDEFKKYTYTVIFARYADKWLYCKAKGRDVFETAGGRIEAGETPLECAKRELREETGAATFEISPCFDYEVGEGSYGQVFYAEISELGQLSADYEMEEVALFPMMPPVDKLRFPHILPVLFKRVQRWMSDRQSADELMDIYDENRVPTGRTKRRAENAAAGDYVMVVIIWIRDTAGRFLITRRAPGKGYPGMWEFQGGAATAGDDSLTAAIREAKEETGLTLLRENAEIIHTEPPSEHKQSFVDVWLFTQDFSLEDVQLQEGETVDAKLATIPEIREMVAEGVFLTNEYTDGLLTKLEG